MIDMLPVPVLWLVFYLVGKLSDTRSVVFRRYALVLVSSFLLFGGGGGATWLFYTGIGLGVVGAGLLLERMPPGRNRTILFVASLVGLVLMIIVFLKFRPYFFKYFVALPSLSYLGFRAIAYIVSCYRGHRGGFSAGLMQMFFFPVWFLGPITRVENFDETQHDDRSVLERMIIGFSMLIAAHFVSPLVVQHPSSSADLHAGWFWLSAVANSFEFYFMFAGYSHLIIATGLLAGFKVPDNFNNPYMATSIRDFWRRWHMSLSFWIRDYLYIPLGGNRKGIVRKCLNLLAAMAICGVWHGLTLNYLLWGLFHGALLAWESILDHLGYAPIKRLVPHGHQAVRVVTTFSLVTFSWILFKYPVPEVLVCLRAMLPW